MRELVERLKDIGYEVDPTLVVDPQDFDNSMKDVVVIISGQGKSLFKTINNIANNELDSIDFDQDDVIVVASPVVPGVENEFKSMENDMYKKEGEIIVLDKNVLSMHPSKEDLKMMIFLTKPKYYIPIKGEYRLLHMNSQIAVEWDMIQVVSLS